MTASRLDLPGLLVMTASRLDLPGLLGLTALTLSGCLGELGVTPGYPWIESRRLILAGEDLQVTLAPGGAAVTALLHFVGAGRGDVAPVEAGFPEDARDPPLEQLGVSFDGRPLAVRAERGGIGGGHLPLDQVGRWHGFTIPSLPAGSSRTLAVRYRQRLGDRATVRCFRYLIRTGAYWRGPIGRLEVEVKLSGGLRAARARLDGRPGAGGESAEGQGVRWSLREIEPREDLVIELDSARKGHR